MKLILMLAAVFTLNSCNTLIGMGRDTKQGYQWTKSKFEGTGGTADPSGAPVY